MGRRIRGFLRGVVTVAVAVLAGSAGPARTQSSRLTVEDAVALYARGDFDGAVVNLDTSGLRVEAFTRALDRWIEMGDRGGEPRRRTIAVTFALEAVWTATRTAWNVRPINRDPWQRDSEEDPLIIYLEAQGRVASWAMPHLPAGGAPDAVERLLRLAALGVAEDGHAWYRVQHHVVPPSRQRFSDEPRFRLADVLASTNRELGPMRRGELSFPNYRPDVLRNETRAVNGIPEAIRAFTPLLADPALAGEVELRIGYLELRRDQWRSAITRFDAARVKAAEPALLAATDYLTGWVYEQLGRTDDAIAAYRRALAITPLMRNLAMRQSALLFLTNQRAEAYAVLDPAINARPVQTDLLVMIERADARFVPEWFALIRKALQ
jgi:tetratricopeptide (TPR) repeat protein